jgi:DNA-binding NarL/FixJ family response regulator
MTITVLVADDHPVVRDGLRGMLDSQPDLMVIGEAADGQQALTAVARHAPDVVLMDLRMPELDGSTPPARSAPSTRPCGCSCSPPTTMTPTSSVLSRPAPPATCSRTPPRHELFDAVRAAARGETVLAPAVAAKLMRQLREPAEDPLTDRELDVLRLVAQGLTNKAIATELHVSEATVKTHLVHTFTKLDVDDRTAAVMAALQRGLLHPITPDPLSESGSTTDLPPAGGRRTPFRVGRRQRASSPKGASDPAAGSSPAP